MSFGAIYVATHKDNRSKNITVNEVLRSVRLLRTYSPNIPKAIVATKKILQNKNLTKHFDYKIQSKYPNFNGFMGSKIQALELSPFEHTLILDNDTLPILDISNGFNFIKSGIRDIALSIAPRQELRDNSGITNFQNGVMFVHKNKRTIEFFSTWLKEVRKDGFDSPTRYIFSKLLLNNPNIKLYALSYFWNFRIDLLLDFNITLGILKNILPQVRVLHTHLQRTRAINIFNKYHQVNEIKTIIGFQG